MNNPNLPHVRHTASFTTCLSPLSFLIPQFIVESGWLEHGPFAFWLTESLRPRVFVELGTHNGYSFFVFAQAVQALGLKTRCHAIDTWQGDDHAGFYNEKVYQRVLTIQRQHFADCTTLIRSRFDEALHGFQDQSIDLLHIDGRHGYEDVLEDYSAWLPKLAPGAIVLFHDTQVTERAFGVWRLWQDLSTRHPSFEFLHGNGLGILCPDGQVPNRLQPLFDATSEEKEAIRHTYATLGGAITDKFQRAATEHPFQPRDRLIQLYFRNADHEFTAKGHTIQGFEDTYVSIELMIPRSMPLSDLRLDPSNQPGWYLIHQLDLVSPEGQSVWNLCPNTSLTLIKDILILKSQCTSGAFLVRSTSDDPQILLASPRTAPLEVPQGARLRLTIQSLNDAQIKQELLGLSNAIPTQLAVTDGVFDEISTTLTRDEQQRNEIDILRASLQEFGDNKLQLEHKMRQMQDAKSLYESDIDYMKGSGLWRIIVWMFAFKIKVSNLVRQMRKRPLKPKRELFERRR